MIEIQLKRIADALEKLVGGPAANPGVDLVPVVVAPKAEAPKKAKAEKVAKAPKNDLFEDAPAEEESVKEATEETVREIVKKFAEKNSPEEAMVILAKFKVKKLREIKPEQYNAIYAAFEAEMAE